MTLTAEELQRIHMERLTLEMEVYRILQQLETIYDELAMYDNAPNEIERITILKTLKENLLEVHISKMNRYYNLGHLLKQQAIQELLPHL